MALSWVVVEGSILQKAEALTFTPDAFLAIR